MRFDGTAAAESVLHGRVVFVLAPPHSGGETVRDALGALPSVTPFPVPSHLFDQGLTTIDLTYRMSGNNGMRGMADEDRYLRAVRRLADSTLQPIAGPEGLLVEYTPEHAALAELIVRIYPDAQLVHVVRDQRDVVQEMLARRPRVQRRPKAAAREVADVHRAIRNLEPPPHCVVFEDLVAAPGSTFSSLTIALGLDPTPDTIAGAVRVVERARVR